MTTDTPPEILGISVVASDAVPYGRAFLIGPAGEILAIFYPHDPPRPRTVVVQVGAPTADPAVQRALAAFRQRHACDSIEEDPCTP